MSRALDVVTLTLPEPVAWMHDGYVSTNKERVLYDEQKNRNCGFKARPVHALYTADQLRTAIAAERARTADTHAAYCHSQQQFHDAVAELSTLRQQLADAVYTVTAEGKAVARSKTPNVGANLTTGAADEA